MLTPSNPADHAAVVELVNAAYRGSDGKAGWTHESDYLFGPRTTVELLRADLGAAPGAQVLVWRDAPGEPVIGCLWLEPAEAGVWYLGLLSVSPELQDRRLGRTILEAAEGWAQAQGARRIRLTVVNIRDTLIAWYERRGYALTGKTQAFPYGDDRFGKPGRDDLVFVVLEKAL